MNLVGVVLAKHDRKVRRELARQISAHKKAVLDAAPEPWTDNLCAWANGLVDAAEIVEGED